MTTVAHSNGNSTFGEFDVPATEAKKATRGRKAKPLPGYNVTFTVDGESYTKEVFAKNDAEAEKMIKASLTIDNVERSGNSQMPEDPDTDKQ